MYLEIEEKAEVGQGGDTKTVNLILILIKKGLYPLKLPAIHSDLAGSFIYFLS